MIGRRWRAGTLAAAAALAGCHAAPATPPMQRAELAMQRALQRVQDTRNPSEAFQEAIDALDERLESDPADRDALRMRAAAYRHVGDWLVKRGRNPSGAFKRSGLTLRKLLALDPRDVVAWRALARLKSRHGGWLAAHGKPVGPLFDDAVAIYNRLLATAPQDTALRRERGGALLGQARAAGGERARARVRLEQALADLNVAMGARSNDVESSLTRARVRLQLATVGERDMREIHLQRGMADANAAVALAPDDARGFVTRAELGQALAQHEFANDRDPRPGYLRAVADISMALELDPKRDPADWKLLADTRFLLAQAEASLGGDPKADWQHALDAYEHAVRVAPALADAVRERREACRSQLGR